MTSGDDFPSLTGHELTRDDVAALVRANNDLVAVLRTAEHADRAALYEQLGLMLTYDHGKQKVLVEVNLNQNPVKPRGATVCVRGGTCTIGQRDLGVRRPPVGRYGVAVAAGRLRSCPVRAGRAQAVLIAGPNARLTPVRGEDTYALRRANSASG